MVAPLLARSATPRGQRPGSGCGRFGAAAAGRRRVVRGGRAGHVDLEGRFRFPPRVPRDGKPSHSGVNPLHDAGKVGRRPGLRLVPAGPVHPRPPGPAARAGVGGRLGNRPGQPNGGTAERRTPSGRPHHASSKAKEAHTRPWPTSSGLGQASAASAAAMAVQVRLAEPQGRFALPLPVDRRHVERGPQHGLLGPGSASRVNRPSHGGHPRGSPSTNPHNPVSATVSMGGGGRGGSPSGSGAGTAA